MKGFVVEPDDAVGIGARGQRPCRGAPIASPEGVGLVAAADRRVRRAGGCRGLGLLRQRVLRERPAMDMSMRVSGG